ncbi:MAG: metallophosphatase family protein [Chloroflexi bacterium]|nr:metallophosphatase family protein [Chloroflexota bacterium]
MQVAFISDIHGNLISLNAVLADIDREQVDELVCLGDVATLGPQPRETVDRLRELACHFIVGNHDDDVRDILGTWQRDDHPPFIKEAIEWCAQELTQEQLDFIGSFQSRLELALDDNLTLLCFHGSPQSTKDVILPTTPDDQLDAYLRGYRATVLVGGHTHVQMLRRHKGMLLVNPGSVGIPMDQQPPPQMPVLYPWAEYAIVTVQNGNINIELRRVAVDIQAIKQASLSSDHPLQWANLWPTK